jgi:hypothetical protein
MIPGIVVIRLEDYYMVRMQKTTSPDLIVQIDVECNLSECKMIPTSQHLKYVGFIAG